MADIRDQIIEELDSRINRLREHHMKKLELPKSIRRIESSFIKGNW